MSYSNTVQQHTSPPRFPPFFVPTADTSENKQWGRSQVVWRMHLGIPEFVFPCKKKQNQGGKCVQTQLIQSRAEVKNTTKLFHQHVPQPQCIIFLKIVWRLSSSTMIYLLWRISVTGKGLFKYTCLFAWKNKNQSACNERSRFEWTHSKKLVLFKGRSLKINMFQSICFQMLFVKLYWHPVIFIK